MNDKHYIVEESNKDRSHIQYYLQGHSVLTSNAKSVSKYYTYTKIRGANMLASKLAKNDTKGYKYQVVACEDVGIEVK